MKDIKWGCLGIIGFIILVIIIANLSLNKTDTPDSSSESMAFVMATQMFANHLKSPSSAQFASYSESEVKILSNSSYLVTSHVDSQNSFGAMIRTYFSVEMTYEGNKKWAMKIIKTEE